MRKVICCLYLLICSVEILCAQDILTKRSGEDIKTIVLEISPNEVKYKLYEEPDGVTYMINKSDVLMIRYKSGRTEVFEHKNYSDLFYTDREPVIGLVPDMTYKQLKLLYNPKEYDPTIGDRYDPVLSGVASAFVPGLGELINGEWRRGLVVLLGDIALLSTGVCLGVKNSASQSFAQYQLAWLCYFASLGLDIWSIVDAVRIAKVKNMYEQDLKKTSSVQFGCYPSLNYIQTHNCWQPTVGFTLAMTF